MRTDERARGGCTVLRLARGGRRRDGERRRRAEQRQRDRHHHASSHRERLSAPGQDVHYRLTVPGHDCLAALGVALPAPVGDGERSLRYCVDWTEQAHHLSGGVGRALAERMLALGWPERLPRGRAVLVTEHGRRALPAELGVGVP